MIKTVLSYIYPVTTKVESRYSGNLEITITNGKKVLDTKNVNYSYGLLQKVLRYSLNQIDINGISNVLVLGMGGGGVIKILREEKGFKGDIRAVEIDDVIIDIAKNEFSIDIDDNTQIICEDAWSYVFKENFKYDLIIIDLFIDNKIPEKFLFNSFWKKIISILDENGFFIFNTLCYPKTDLTHLKEKLKKRNISFEVYRYVEKYNKVLIAHK